jgi:hypothetical protein
METTNTLPVNAVLLNQLEDAFLLKFKQTYLNGSFASPKELIEALAVVASEELGSMIEIQRDGVGRLH